METLSTILTSQVEDGRRDEWMSAILRELLSSRRSSDDGATSDASLPNTNVTRTSRQPHLPPSATPALHVLSSASLKEFSVWRQKFEGFVKLTGVSSLRSADQMIALVSLLDDEWTRTLRYGLNLDDQASLQETLAAMETHLRRQRNVMVDRRDFYSLVQQPGERFDDFLCAVK